MEKRLGMMEKPKELTAESREKITFELWKKFKTMKSYMHKMDSLIHELMINKEEDVYDWTKDKNLNVNKKGYDPKKD